VQPGDSWTLIVNGIAALLSADPDLASFTITPIPSLLKIRLQAAMDFKLSLWVRGTTGSDITAIQSRVQIQPYIARIPAQPGQPQILRLTISDDLVRSCATYILVFNDPEGDQHSVEYYASMGDGRQQILIGLTVAISASEDSFFRSVGTSIDPGLGIMDVTTIGGVSIDATVNPETSVYWEKILFPYALIEPVVRGAYSDALREAGQTDKGMAEEQGAVQEQADRVTKALAPGYTDLTDQRAPAPRYRGKLIGQNPAK
jgi:hypothetical protein